MKKSIIFSVILFAAACAKNPENIAATDVGAQTYKAYSCSQLAREKLNISQSLENLSASQRQAASSDAWGVFLLGLPVSSMSGNDKEAAISIAKGQIQAIDEQRQLKRCG